MYCRIIKLISIQRVNYHWEILLESLPSLAPGERVQPELVQKQAWFGEPLWVRLLQAWQQAGSSVSQQVQQAWAGSSVLQQAWAGSSLFAFAIHELSPGTSPTCASRLQTAPCTICDWEKPFSAMKPFAASFVISSEASSVTFSAAWTGT